MCVCVKTIQLFYSKCSKVRTHLTVIILMNNMERDTRIQCFVHAVIWSLRAAKRMMF